MRIRGAPAAFAAVLCSTAAASPTIHTLEQRDRWWQPFEPATAAVSADGRYVAFTSYVPLVPGDINERRDVYVLDRRDGSVTFESATATGRAGQSDSSHPRLSADGRFLVYETTDFHHAGSPTTEIVLRDRRSGTARVLTAGPHGERANGPSRMPAISADGAVVVFAATATNLVPGADANGPSEDIYLFDARTGSLARVSLDDAGRQLASGSSIAPAISADGRYVAFASTADFGRANAGAATARPQHAIFVRDKDRSVTTRVSMPPDRLPADGASWAPSISADGRYVAFVSAATNLVPGDRNRAADVFLADLTTRSLELVSRNASGAAANGPSGSPAVSGDGRFVVFQSDASDLLCTRRCTLASEDINLLWDVFLLDREKRTIVRISGDAAAGWIEPSAGAALSAAGEVLVFSSRHPIDQADTRNDFDLFVCARSDAAPGGLLRQRPDGFDHGHQPHPFSHRDVLTEDPFDDAAIDRGYFRWG
jgi:Tol biopolymer transport system component